MARNSPQSKAEHARQAPSTLSASSQVLWTALVDEYALEDAAGLAILKTGLEARDRMLECSARIEEDGLLLLDRFDQKKPHPLLPAERDARSQFLAALKHLNLDLEPLANAGRR